MTPEEAKVKEKELYRKIEEAGKTISELYKELKECRNTIISHKFDVNIGDIVLYKGSKFLITDFDTFWPMGCEIKKNGEPSKSIRNLYDNFTKLEK